MGCVYILSCKRNAKVYVGKTKQNNLARYFRHNTCLALSGSDNKPKLYRAIRKYGADSFVATKLFESDNESLLFGWEKYLIKEWDSIENGYNIAAGGQGAGYKHGPNCKHCLWARTKGAEILKANRHKHINPPKGVRPPHLISFGKGHVPWNKGKKWI